MDDITNVIDRNYDTLDFIGGHTGARALSSTKTADRGLATPSYSVRQAESVT
jgi:hypothetical protein